MNEAYDGIEIIDPLEALEHKRRGIDARGLLMCWERPDPRATYYMGIDPTRGIVGWRRDLRLQQDKNIDNGVIEVVKLGRNNMPDIQVAEYAAPVDPQDLARVGVKVGRMYSGAAERGCLCICETNGVGITCQADMLHKYHYYNMYIWEKLGSTAGVQRTTVYGWQASRDANIALFQRGHRHIVKSGVTINSPWLADEMADAIADWNVMNVRAKYGAHDDRLRAFFLALWAAHSWSYDQQDTSERTVEERMQNPAATDMTADEMNDFIEDELERALPQERF